MSRFILPTQKGTELAPYVTRLPVTVRVLNTGDPDLLARAFDRVRGAVQHFYRRCNREFHQSTLELQTRHLKTDEVHIQYTMSFGKESLTVEIDPRVIEEVDEQYAIFITADPVDEEDAVGGIGGPTLSGMLASNNGAYASWIGLEKIYPTAGEEIDLDTFNNKHFGVPYAKADADTPWPNVEIYGVGFDMNYYREAGGGAVARVALGNYIKPYVKKMSASTKEYFTDANGPYSYDDPVQQLIKFTPYQAYYDLIASCGIPSDFVPTIRYRTPSAVDFPAGQKTTYSYPTPPWTGNYHYFNPAITDSIFQCLTSSQYPTFYGYTPNNDLAAAEPFNGVSYLSFEATGTITKPHYILPSDVSAYCTILSPVLAGYDTIHGYKEYVYYTLDPSSFVRNWSKTWNESYNYEPAPFTVWQLEKEAGLRAFAAGRETDPPYPGHMKPKHIAPVKKRIYLRGTIDSEPYAEIDVNPCGDYYLNPFPGPYIYATITDRGEFQIAGTAPSRVYNDYWGYWDTTDPADEWPFD